MDELSIYRRAVEAMSQADLESALRATLEAVVEATGADRGFVVVRTEGSGALETLARIVARPGRYPAEQPSETIVRRALESRAPLRLENALETADLAEATSVLAIPVLSVLAVPIVADGEALAAVYLDSTRLAGIFTAGAEAAATRLAATVAPAIRNAARLAEAGRRERALRARLDALEGAPEILGRSPKFAAALDRALRAAPSEAPILIRGESGTGKELVARAIHRASRRAARALVTINCGALPEGTLEAELFGYRRGAFTGAVRDQAGRVEAAHEGTLFLDEVGDMAPALQVKLLRLLQSGEIQKLGDAANRTVDIRVLAATHRDLADLVRAGRFREDLYYRLRVVEVEVPPLRERGDDVLLLAEAFARKYGRKEGKEILGLSPAAREALLRHRFSGNVREVENAIRHAAIFASGRRIGIGDLPPEIAAAAAAPDASGGARPLAVRAPGSAPRDLEELRLAKQEAAEAMERQFLLSVLERAGGNVARAARLAGMNRTFLHELLAKHAISAEEFRGPAGANARAKASA